MRYPVADIKIVERSDEQVEIRAFLVATGVIDADLDAVVSHMSKAQDVKYANWEVQTQD